MLICAKHQQRGAIERAEEFAGGEIGDLQLAVEHDSECGPAGGDIAAGELRVIG